MSQDYLISARLVDKFTPLNCKRIVKRGQELGIIYPNNNLYKLKSSSVLLSVDKAVYTIMEGTECGKIHFLSFNFFDDYATLIFSAHSDISFSLSLDPGTWKQEFYVFDNSAVVDKHLFVDNARYTRLLLNVLQDFHITNFAISEMFIEHLSKLDKNCLTVKIINQDTFPNRIIHSIYYNKSFVMQSLTTQTPLSVNDVIEYIKPFIHRGVELYIATGDIISKLIITWDIITLYPINPIHKKKLHDQLVLDVDFYVKLLLGICEEYAILELKTTFEHCCS